MPDFSQRHVNTQSLMKFFAYKHLPDGLGKQTSMVIAEAAYIMVERLKDGPELSAGLRKLLEAKDCLVRQALVDQGIIR